MTFQEKLEKIVKKNNSLVCVGLDSDVEKISALAGMTKNKQFLFNKSIIEATNDLVCSYKLNTAFYEAIGHQGIIELKKTCDYIRKNYPEIPIIIDAKRGDIGNTNNGYVQFIFNYLGADALTVNPYLGEEAMGPFLERKDKGVIILCKTSNNGSGEFQNLEFKIQNSELKNKKIKKLYQYVAYQVSHKWNKNKNCLLVVGAIYPEELKEVRRTVGDDIWILVPGIGVQGGDLESVLKAGLNKKRAGLIINSSRGIIFSKDSRKEAKKLKEEINKFRV